MNNSYRVFPSAEEGEEEEEEEGELEEGEEEEENGTVSKFINEKDDDTRTFLIDPTVENFSKLMPDPRRRLCDYLDPTADLVIYCVYVMSIMLSEMGSYSVFMILSQFTGDRSYAATCVDAAFAISEFQHNFSKPCFISLLEKAAFDPLFASYVLRRIGLLQVSAEVLPFSGTMLFHLHLFYT